MTNNQWKNLTQWLRGTMDHVPEVTQQIQVPFTPLDYDKLQSHITFTRWWILVLFPLPLLFCGLVGSSFNSSPAWGFFFGTLVAVAISLFIYWLSTLSCRPLEADLKNGHKDIYWGQVYRVSTRRYSKSYTKYFLHLSPSVVFEIEASEHYGLELGQKVEVHVAPLSHHVLKLTLKPEVANLRK
jgi:hypothetical protein